MGCASEPPSCGDRNRSKPLYPSDRQSRGKRFTPVQVTRCTHDARRLYPRLMSKPTLGDAYGMPSRKAIGWRICLPEIKVFRKVISGPDSSHLVNCELGQRRVTG